MTTEPSEQEAVDRMRELIDRSSLGTPAARALRARTSPEQVADIMRRMKELTAERVFQSGGQTKQMGARPRVTPQPFSGAAEEEQ